VWGEEGERERERERERGIRDEGKNKGGEKKKIHNKPTTVFDSKQERAAKHVDKFQRRRMQTKQSMHAL